MDALLSDLKIQATAASDQHCGLCCGCRSGIHNEDTLQRFTRARISFLKHCETIPR
jgi:hypothetical protein